MAMYSSSKRLDFFAVMGASLMATFAGAQDDLSYNGDGFFQGLTGSAALVGADVDRIELEGSTDGSSLVHVAGDDFGVIAFDSYEGTGNLSSFIFGHPDTYGNDTTIIGEFNAQNMEINVSRIGQPPQNVDYGFTITFMNPAFTSYVQELDTITVDRLIVDSNTFNFMGDLETSYESLTSNIMTGGFVHEFASFSFRFNEEGNPDTLSANIDLDGEGAAAGNFQVITVTPVIPGDLNRDTVVNLLDVSPFVDRISTGTFQAEADVNQDGNVNLLDVAPFVEAILAPNP